MEYSSTAFKGYSVCSITDEITVSEIPSLTPLLSKEFQVDPPQDIVLDLSAVTHIDSSAIRLLVNIKKRLDKIDKNLYLLKPSEIVLDTLKRLDMDSTFNIIQNCDKLQKDLAINIYERFLPYAEKENRFYRLNCSCAICGSHEVSGYLIDPNDYEWRWDAGDPFPSSYSKSNNEPINVFGMLPVVCLDCNMSSIDLTHFHMMDGEKIATHAQLTDEAKSILAKSIKQRKKLVEQTNIEAADLFNFPRSKEACYTAYEIARTCSRSMALGKKVGSHFEIGYTTYLTIQYADPSLKDELINDCRTWFTHVLNDKEAYSPLHLAKAYFILLNVALNLKKPKEALAAFNQLQELVSSLPASDDTTNIDTPHFWFAQAENIWHLEIQSRSGELKI